MAEDDDDAEWLTPPEAARRLRPKAKTLQEYRVTGGGPKFYKLGPGRNARVVYKQVDLRAWVEKHGLETTSEYQEGWEPPVIRGVILESPKRRDEVA